MGGCLRKDCIPLKGHTHTHRQTSTLCGVPVAVLLWKMTGCQTVSCWLWNLFTNWNNGILQFCMCPNFVHTQWALNVSECLYTSTAYWFGLKCFHFSSSVGVTLKKKSVFLTEKYLHISNCLTVLAWFSSLSKFRLKDIVKPLNLKRFFYVSIIYANQPDLFGMLIKICWHKQYRNLALRYFFFIFISFF